MVRQAERAWQRRQALESSSGRNGGHQPTKIPKITPLENPKTVNPETLWKGLCDGFDSIFAPDGSRHSLSQENYMKLFSDVYNYYCKQTVRPNFGLFSVVNDSSGLHLYERLDRYLQNHLKIIGNKSVGLPAEGIFQFYVEQCDEFYWGSKVLNALCAFLNRNMIIPAQKKGASLFLIYELALSNWKNTLFANMHEQVTNSTLKIIAKERQGEKVNNGFIKTVTSSYVELGPVDDTLGVYRTCFENRFLQETEEFYILESTSFIDINSVSQYVMKVEQIMQKEEERVLKFLHHSTLPKVNYICGEVFIKRHFPALKANFRRLLSTVHEDKSNKNIEDDLHRTFILISRLNGTYIDIISQDFQSFVQDLGLTELGQLAGNESIKYVDVILDIYDVYGNLVNKAFQSNLKFSEALDRAFIGFVNMNPITEATRNKGKTAENLARYLDQLLRRTAKHSEKTDEQIERDINNVMTIFRYVVDKDVFEQYYRLALSARLILKTSPNEDMENLVLDKIQRTCGNDSTNKLRRMFQDITGSKGINAEFQTHLAGKNVILPHEFYVNVLAIGTWPVMKEHIFTIPAMMETDVNEFTEFFHGKHNGKKLIWNFRNSFGEIKFTPPIPTPNRGPSYTFVASAHQLAILLLFNENDVLTMAEIEEATKLDVENLKQYLMIFVRSTILQHNDEKDSKADITITLESRMSLNMKYRSKNRHISINKPLKSEVAAGETEAEAHIVKGRNIQIQATIVRIMKMRKTLLHQQLISEVIQILSAKFNPEVRMIRDCIEILIEKEYMERSEEDIKLYVYVA